mmetsp:Transcript_28728/g.95418  ORF Transcript_28728/g.95418 Transcript_28728/m.95418 type:complete len:605 (-) Transcript_28728:57-1871(-)
MDLANMPREILVLFHVHRVQEQEEQVEPRQQRGRQVNVLDRRLVRVVAAEDGVGSRQHGGPGVECRGDAGLRDGHRLLLHDLVDGRAVALLHLIELVDGADAHIGEDQGSAFQCDLASGLVAHHGRRETDAAGALAGGVHRSRGDVANLLDQLTLRHSGVAHEQRVNISADLHSVLHRLRVGSDQDEQQRLLHIFVAENLRSNGSRGHLVQVARPLCLLEFPVHLVLVLPRLAVANLVFLDAVRVDVHRLHGAVCPGLEPRELHGLVHARDRDRVSGEHQARVVAVDDHGDGPGHAADRHVVRHLLNADLLELAELACPGDLPQLAGLLVVLASLAGALLQRREALPLHSQENLGIAHLAMVGHDLDSRLHRRGANDHAIQLHEGADVIGGELTQLHRLARVPRLEAHVEIVLEPQRDAGCRGPRLVAGLPLLGEHSLAPLGDDILCGAIRVEILVPLRQRQVTCLVEILHVAGGVALDIFDETLDGLLQLNLGDLPGIGNRLVGIHQLLLAEVLDIVQVDEDRLHVLIGRLLQHRLILFVAVLRICRFRPLLIGCDKLVAQRFELRKALHGLPGRREVVLGNALTHRATRSHLHNLMSSTNLL